MATPEDLSPEYRAVYDSFRELGLTESEAMTATTCRPLDRHGHGPGSRTARVSEVAAMYAEPGHGVLEAFDALGASVVGRDGGTEEGARRALVESGHSWVAGGAVSSTDVERGVDERVVGLDEAGRRHVVDVVRRAVEGGALFDTALATAVESERRVQAQRSTPRTIELREVGR